MRTMFLTTLVLATCSSAHANFSADLVYGGQVTLNAGVAEYWDIRVLIWGHDDWTAAGLDAYCDTSFYHDPLDDRNPPDPGLFGINPDAEFTSFYSSPATWPNAPYNPGAVGIAFTADGGNILDTDWFDTLATGDGTYTIARVTVLGIDTYAHLDLDVAGIYSGTLAHFAWDVPEPGAMLLMGLGAALVARRRQTFGS